MHDIPEEDNPFKTLQILYEIDDEDGQIVCTGSRSTLIPISYIIHISIRPDKICAAWIESNRICIYGYWYLLVFRSLNHFKLDNFSQMFVLKKTTSFKLESFKNRSSLNELLEIVNLKVYEKVV